MRCGGCRGWLLARAAWLGVLACVTAVLPMQAQSGSDGALGGRVLNAAGAPVVGARIVARSVENGLVLAATSGKSGDFLLVRLPVGLYALSVETGGVEVAVPGEAEVRLGEVTEIEPRVGALGSAGSGVGLQEPVPAASTGEIESLPVADGEWRGLELAEATANPAATDASAPGEVSFRGLDPTENGTAMDGANAEESFSGERLGGGVSEDASGSENAEDASSGPGAGPRSVADGGRRSGAAFTFSQASVREFQVRQVGDAAQYGSAAYGHGGGIVSGVTRRGGAKLHGLASYVQRNSAWAAADPFAIATDYANGVVSTRLVKPTDVTSRYTGGVGGPLSLARLLGGSSTRDGSGSSRLFFYVALDGMHRNFPAISTPGSATFYDLTAMQTALLANRGVSVAKTAAVLSYLSGLTGTIPRKSDEDVQFGRLDWQGSGGQRVSLEVNRARWSNPAGARGAAVVDRAVASIGSSFGKVDMGVLRWVRPLGGSTVNEVRAQLGRDLAYETAQMPLAQEPAIGPGGLPPEVSIGPLGLVFGTPAGLGRRAWPDERRLEGADVLLWTHGRHMVQVGADVSAIRDFTDSLTNGEGTFNYDSGTTNGRAGGLVDWITDYTFGVNAYPNGGCPSITAATHDFCFRSYSQSFGQQSLRFTRQEWAGFVQEDWRARPGLTVHAGLRYEYGLLPFPQQPNAGLDAVFGARGATSVFPEDRNNFGPRLGVVWQPGRGSGRISAGYGVYYGQLPGATIQAALLDTAMSSSVTRIRILPTTETVCPQQTAVGFGYPCSFLTQPAGVVAATTSAVVFDRRFRLPMIQQGTLSYEHEVGGGVLARVSYVMNLDRQLPNSVDINIEPSKDVKMFQLQGGMGKPGARNGETFAVPVYTTRISPSFGPVTDIVSNVNATYHGMTVEARRGYGGSRSAVLRGLEFRAAFTWSKAIDFGQNAGARPRVSGQFDPFNVRYDKGLSALNFPHRLAISTVWSPGGAGLARMLGGGAVARAMTGGWRVSAIGSESSGRGYSYEVFGGTRLMGGRESINGSGGSVVLPTTGRNTLRLPDRLNVNLRMERGFHLPHEGMRLLASMEAFNATNHVNISGVEQRAYLAGTAVNGVTPLVFQDAAAVAAEGLNVEPFGTYTSSATSQSRQRELQLTLRFEF